jgi:DNA-binding MarR family transcriptional regulator
MANNIGKLNAAIHRNLQSILNYKLKDISIRSGQYDFFYVISFKEGITQKELSERLYIGKSTTAKVVKKLIANGYIRKEKVGKDKRYDCLYLTEKGKEIADRIHKTFLEVLEITTRNLSQSQIEQTSALLQIILRNLLDEEGKMDDENVVSEL